MWEEDRYVGGGVGIEAQYLIKYLMTYFKCI